MLPQRRKWLVLPPPAKPLEEYTKDEILWLLRTELEGDHRHKIHLGAIRLHYLPSVRDVDHLPEMDILEFLDTCNKSVPVYILRGPQWRLFGQVLHNYIYRRWFRPYQSEIECQRFICKFITPCGLPDESPPSQSTIDSLLALNSAICAEVRARRQDYDKQIALGGEDVARRLYWVRDNRLHVLQPLFQALLIIVCSEDYHNEDSKTVGRLPVFLVRTGIEDGLSAPITFETIADKIDGDAGEAENIVKTTLETAVDFVISLEAREAATLGLHPDPVVAWERSLEHVPPSWKEILGDELLTGPSSKFIDSKKYPEWAGAGEDEEARIMVHHERQRFRWEAMRIAGTY
ncbi:hypothetical protein F4779DRAFT_586939 [Xylariaceae sp. FL0662B]|nr:hypothetical protein F4779DRAFT_586939 [Xylariaceae sp. FL0662B]